MGSNGTIRLSRIFEMLDKCAPGYKRTPGDHYWRVDYNGRFYPTLPLGKHGRRTDPEIEIGHVRRMARTLGVYDCARKALEQLR